jgi:hypothetical protein
MNQNNLAATIIISITILVIAGVASITFYNYNELKSVERNIESAIVKGIDPVAVRCAYSRSTDTICIAYGSASRPK